MVLFYSGCAGILLGTRDSEAPVVVSTLVADLAGLPCPFALGTCGIGCLAFVEGRTIPHGFLSPSY